MVLIGGIFCSEAFPYMHLMIPGSFLGTRHGNVASLHDQMGNNLPGVWMMTTSHAMPQATLGSAEKNAQFCKSVVSHQH